MFTDLVLNGRGEGPVGQVLGGVRFDPGLLRPYTETNPSSSLFGRKCVTVNTGRTRYDEKLRQTVPVYQKMDLNELARRHDIYSPVANAMTLPKDAWIQLDAAVVKATRLRLRAWADLAAANSRGGFNGMAKMTFEYQAMTDAGEAIVDMDGITDGRTDRPLFNLKSIPLPITHSDFWFSQREVAVSRNTGTPLDTTMAEQAGRRVAEMIEQTTIGLITGATYGPSATSDSRYTGTSTVYGYTNFPSRIVKNDLTVPTGTNPEAVLADFLEMIETMQVNGFMGPYIVYASTAYSRWLNDDYFRTGSTSAVRTLRERLMQIEGITEIRRLDYLTSGYQLIMVQMTPDVAEAINAMGITTVQWESQGGMRQNFKVMAIQVPLLKTRFLNNTTTLTTGILHATTAA